MTPTCPKHGGNLRTGKYSWYCPHPDPEGPKGYCTYRVKNETREGEGSLAGTVQKIVAERYEPVKTASEFVRMGPMSETIESRALWALDMRVSAALNFAGRLYAGCGGGQELEAQALNLAERALLMFERKP